MFSLFRKIEDKVHPIPLKERVDKAVFRLNNQRQKLDQMTLRLQQRDRDMFQRCIGAQVSKDFARAKMFANECAEIRKMASVVLGSQLALEKVILRLQTVEEFGDVLVQIAPIMGVVKETKGRIAGVIPEVATELEEINSLLSDVKMETGEVMEKSADTELPNEEAKQVLKESAEIAEEKMREQFPELPSLEMVTSQAEKPVLLTEIDSAVSVEEMVLDYVKERSGRMSLSQCANELNLSQDSVKKALQKLKEEGKIVVS